MNIQMNHNKLNHKKSKLHPNKEDFMEKKLKYCVRQLKIRTKEMHTTTKVNSVADEIGLLNEEKTQENIGKM